MKKHFMAILLSFCMMLTFLPGKVFAYEVNIVDFSKEDYTIVTNYANSTTNEGVKHLLNYIIEKGQINNGYKFIQATYNLNGILEVSILYRNDKDILIFHSNFMSGNITISASYDYDIISCKAASKINVTCTGNGIGEQFTAQADFDIAKYSESTVLSFKKPDYVQDDSPLFTYPSNFNEICNSSLLLSVKGWELLLTEKVNLKLSDIGFTNYPNGEANPNPPDESNPPVDPNPPTTPGNLALSVSNGGLGKKITVQITGGHWLTVQTRRAGSVALSSIQAPGSGSVTLAFSAAAGSSIQVWETETEMTFNSQGVPNNKILATASQSL